MCRSICGNGECGVICIRKMSYMLDKGYIAEMERISAEVG